MKAVIFSLCAILMVYVGPVSGAAASELMSVQDAYQQSKADELILIDIRSRQEWRDSGIAETAVPLSMHENGFLEGFAKIKRDNPDKKIALICATGGRTNFIQSELRKRNLGHVIDVSEGMFGNHRGKGWIASGLPVRPFDQ